MAPRAKLTQLVGTFNIKRLEFAYSTLKRELETTQKLINNERIDGRNYSIFRDGDLVVSCGKLKYTDGERILSDLDGPPGMSGGPVIDLNSGQVVGAHNDITSLQVSSTDPMYNSNYDETV